MSGHAPSRFAEPRQAGAVVTMPSVTPSITGPLVTVVIPAYNAMRYLPEALGSVLNQTYPNFEVVIINDGSQDDIEVWYRSLDTAVKHRVKLFSQPNQGISSARNAGISHSDAPYVAFLDADDIWFSHKLERQVAYLEANPSVSLTYSWAAAVDSRGKLLGRVYGAQGCSRKRHHKRHSNMWSQLVVSNVISTPSTVLVRRDCLDAVGTFDLDLSSFVEDKDLWLRIARAHTMRMMPEVLIHKRRHSTNTSKKWKDMERASYRVLSKAFASPPEGMSPRQLNRLKRKSYGETNLKLAWKPLQTDEVDMKISLSYFLKALSHCPTLIVSKESLKLMCVVAAITLLGTQRYRLSLQKVAGLRSRLSKQQMASPVASSS